MSSASRASVLSLLLAPLAPGAGHAFPATAPGRAQALQVLQGLNVELLTNDSATATLEKWCADHNLAPNPRVTAKLVRGTGAPATEEVRGLLQAAGAEPIRHRKVELRCGDHVLSEADNWYRPGQLTPEMNRLLDETDTPFGRAVAELKFKRRTLSATVLFTPQPDEPPSDADKDGQLDIPDYVLEHRAVLTTEGDVPFSVVYERYTEEVLAFEPPAPND